MSEARNRRGRGSKQEDGAAEAVSMYQSREKVYPRGIKGRFQSLRKFAVFALLGLYYLLPWVTWNGRQAVLLDLPAREFHIFGLTFWPQDFFFLALLLIICALSLFFVTALAGRVWCGYACPQTVWTEVFLWIEHWTEGDRPRRMKLDRGPWNREKVIRKFSKHGIWILLAAWTGLTFVGFFTPIRELSLRVITLDLGPWETFWLVFYGFATWGNAGFMRENVCLYMCPYARFQSAMFDRDTLVISYDEARGEPRGPRKRGADPAELGLGDCIDCTLCVQVCPTGIDIRDGLQYECIACGACIDACDQVMDKMGYPRGLIRYTTENTLEGKPTRILRPRVIVYSVLLLALITGTLTAVAMRTPMRVDILPDRNALYRELDGGRIENVYDVKVLNMSQQAHTYTVSASGLPGITADTDPERIEIASGEQRNVPVRLRVDASVMSTPGTDVELTVTSEDGSVSVTETTRFHGPYHRGE